jgi:hypothetical protein
MGAHSYLSEYIAIYVNVICLQLYEISHDDHIQWPKHAEVRQKYDKWCIYCVVYCV